MLFTKEFYEILDFFESNTIKQFYGLKEGKESKDLWSKGYYFKDGKTNEMFKIFLHGYQLCNSMK